MRLKLILTITLIGFAALMHAGNKVHYLLPEFKFEYNRDYFQVDAYPSSHILTGKEPEDELYVRSRKINGNYMHIQTSFASSHATSEINSYKNYYDYYYDEYSRYTWIQPVDYELSKELITVNGLTFSLSKMLNEACGREGKQSNYYYILNLDTVFQKFSRLKVSYTTNQVDEWDLSKERTYIGYLLEFFSGFSFTTIPNVMATSDQRMADEIEGLYKINAEKESARTLKRMKRAFRKDTTGRVLSLNSASIITQSKILEYRKLDQFQQLADTIFAIRRQYADQELNTYLTNYKNYNFSRERLAQYLMRLARNDYPYDYYLNTSTNRLPIAENGLDTLQKLLGLSTANPDRILWNWEYVGSGWEYSRVRFQYLDTIDDFQYLNLARSYRTFIPDLVRKIYEDDLKSTNPEFYPYIELIDNEHMKSFMVFNPAQYHQSELLLATFRNSGSTWQLEIDTLDTNLRIRGKERLRAFGDYFLFEQRDSIYLLDCRTSPVSMTSLPYTGDSLDQYIFSSKELRFGQFDATIEITNCQFQRDKLTPETIATLWNQFVRDKKIILNSEYEPCYTCIDLNHGDSLIAPMTYYNYARMSVPADQACYRSGYKIRDLDGDGSNEMFCYTVSNGDLKEWTCYALKEGRVNLMERTRAKALIEQDGDCINLKAFSRIGKRTKQTIQAE